MLQAFTALVPKPVVPQYLRDWAKAMVADDVGLTGEFVVTNGDVNVRDSILRLVVALLWTVTRRA